MDESLNQRIKSLRKEKGLTQLQLAQMLDLTDKAVSKWEANDGNPDISLLPKLADIFDVTIDYLLTGKEVEIISLDDINDQKRREYLIKKDDLDNFIKYDYANNNLYFNRNWHITNTGVYILSQDYWSSILKQQAYRIFEYCFKDVIERIESVKVKSETPISYVEIFGDFFEDFIHLTVEHDRLDWLTLINFKFASITDNSRSRFKTASQVANSVGYIFKNRDKCPNCFKYLLDIEHKNKQNGYYHTCLDDLIVDECIKNKLYDEVESLFIQFNKEVKEIDFGGNAKSRYFVDGTYVTGKNYYNSGTFILGRCVTATESQLNLLIADGNLELVKFLIKHNADVNNILNGCLKKEVITMTDSEIDKKVIELDNKLTPMQKCKKIIEKSDVVSFAALTDLWNKSLTDANLNTCKNILKTKYITYFELICDLYEKKDWKKLFMLAVDCENQNIINYFKSGNYEEGAKALIDLSIGSPGNSKLYLRINEDKIDFKKVDYKNSSLDIIKSKVSSLIEDAKNAFIENCESQLEREKLNEKMNNITNEITKEYIQSELKKGNVELVIIKLCSRLEARLSIIFDREDDLFNLLNDYCNKNLRQEEWDYAEDEYRDTSDETQIGLLNKLRINRNNIAHPQKDCEPITLDELEKCIDYVFNI